jgi:hypothetical protein
MERVGMFPALVRIISLSARGCKGEKIYFLLRFRTAGGKATKGRGKEGTFLEKETNPSAAARK